MMTDQEVLAEMRSESNLNRARRLFSSWSGRIEQAGAQRRPITPIEMRRWEFQAVQEIAAALNAPAEEPTSDDAREGLDGTAKGL